MKRFKKILQDYRINGYIVPKNDQYFNEYVNQSTDRLKFISNFSGSAGYAIILRKKSYSMDGEDIFIVEYFRKKRIWSS